MQFLGTCRSRLVEQGSEAKRSPRTRVHARGLGGVGAGAPQEALQMHCREKLSKVQGLAKDRNPASWQ
eukprot:1439195-Pyramimonas_sp.AAC.1